MKSIIKANYEIMFFSGTKQAQVIEFGKRSDSGTFGGPTFLAESLEEAEKIYLENINLIQKEKDI